MDTFNKELLDFIKHGSTSFTCTEYIKNILLDNGYQELTELDIWKLESGKYFVIRNDASIIAFNLPKNINNQFNIVCTHSDTPGFMIKPNPEYEQNGYLKLNVAPYGGILNYGFMDRPLSIAGRVILKKDNTYRKKIIDLEDAVAIIPSVAIHQNDKANTNLDINTAIDLMPIISLNKKDSLNELIKEKLNIKDDIYDYDLYLYNVDAPRFINKDFIGGPRIDNLTCTYAALKGFINTFNDSINMLAVFNSEEIGSNTYDGADSNFLIDTIKKLCECYKIDLPSALANSVIISADNTHAFHPNHAELSDHTNTPKLNSGILIIKEVNGTTNSITGTIFKHISEVHNINCTYYTSKNDFAGGSTQAGANLKHLSIYSLDVGLPMLAMHSGYELIGNRDTYELYIALNKFFQIKYKLEHDKIIFM